MRGRFSLITIRPERKEDFEAIHQLNLLAFKGEDEAKLVLRIRQSASFIPELSLVALKKDLLVGHILFSPIIIETQKGAVSALALAPMAVRPEFQNQGVGSELVRQGLEECRQMGHGVVIVVSHPTYYPRFGFSQAKKRGLNPPFPVPDEAFMVFELTPGGLRGISGEVKYPPAFDESG